MNKQKNYTAKTTILIGHIEGISYLLLLFIAMPMKYMYGHPEATRAMGTIHGILFCAYVYFLFESWGKLKWKLSTLTILFILSLIPFGTFFQRKTLNKMQ